LDASLTRSPLYSQCGQFANAHAFNSDVSGWNLSRVTDMTGMLTGTTTFRQNLCAWGPQLLQPNLTAPNAPPRFKANVEGMFLNAMACESTDDPSLQWHEAQVAEPVMTVGPFCTFCSIDNSTSG
jgi:surface protein